VILLALLSCSTPPPPCQAPVERVVLVIVDTLRPDAEAPELSAFAEQSAVFTQAVGVSSWTRPTVTTLFTGLGPEQHRNGYFDSVLSEQAVTVAERYREAGWTAWGAYGNAVVRSEQGLGQGLDPWLGFFTADNRSSRSGELVQRVLEGLGGPRELVIVHTIGPHEPYTPTAASAAATGARTEGALYEQQLDPHRIKRVDQLEGADGLDQMKRLYAAEVLDEAAALGPLLRDPRLDEALVIVTSDHGQANGDQGRLFHGIGVFSSQTHIPLMVRGPGVAPGERHELVTQQDVHSTLLAAAGFPVERDLRCPLEPLPAFDLAEFDRGHPPAFKSLARIEGRSRGQWQPEGDKAYFFEDWLDDSPEKRLRQDARLDAMRALARPEAVPGLTTVVPRDKASDRQLRALGYIE
jgi:arylsulfatase A-like enzyme